MAGDWGGRKRRLSGIGAHRTTSKPPLLGSEWILAVFETQRLDMLGQRRLPGLLLSVGQAAKRLGLQPQILLFWIWASKSW